MSSESPIWITEAEVVSLIDLGEAITVVERGFSAQAAGDAVNMHKAQAKWPGGTLHTTGGTLHADGYVGTKSWCHTDDGATPLVLLWRAGDGALLAVIEAFALGQYRTAAVSGVATSRLAPADATELAILGTGAQALTQVAAVRAVRNIEKVRVWSPRTESRRGFSQAVRDALGLDVLESESPAAAVDGAGVVTTVTRATEPFLAADAVTPGTHVNALGAIGLDRAELEPGLLDRADVVVVDDIGSARNFSRELRDHYGTEDDWAGVTSLATVVGGSAGRPDGADVTVFKAMGVGIADVAIAAFIYEQALENRLGAPLPTPARSRPRLRSSLQRAAAG